ncbi:MAG: ParB/Srx family N-terminal domain-containing protein [Parasphingorhabdus sp.]|uniref:ParB/Srx family N-terminal domain-containing protein n=1 Tax=Parasphingorhabdus sp. TaxID=2709688 RepID=UPI003297E7CA
MFESNAARAVTDARIDTLVPYARNARTHSKKQIRQIADSIEHFGFTNPVLVSDENEIVAGHGRVEAAKRQAELLLEPKLDKKARRETYKFVNKAMQPFLKLRGFRSLAELERAREEIGDECSG